MTETFGLLRAPTHVQFGAGQRYALGPVVAGLGRYALVCTDSRMAGTAEFAGLLDSLRDAGVRFRVYAEVEAEVPTTSVEACLRDLGDEHPDAVVGVGGGSCIDQAKVTALLLSHGGSPRDYFGEFQVPGPCVPVVAVPTTAGTGSEVTPVAVLADPDREMKVGISSPYLIPRAAIVDPELTYSCPQTLTAHAAADALAHCIEAYTAIRRVPKPRLSVEHVFVGKALLTDQYAVTGITLIGRSAATVLADPGNEAGRHDLMLAALYGGLALGTAGTAAAHALQYPLGAATHTSHGAGVGALLPYVMQFNLPARIPEFSRIAEALGEPAAGTENDRAQAAVDRVADLLAGLGIPTTLKQMGLAADQVPWLAARGMTAVRLVRNNPRPLDVPDLELIATAAFKGDRETLR